MSWTRSQMRQQLLAQGQPIAIHQIARVVRGSPAAAAKIVYGCVNLEVNDHKNIVGYGIVAQPVSAKILIQ